MADFTQNRSNYIRIFFVAIPFILIVRLLFLQVFGSGGYKDAAIGQAVYIKKIYPPRGIIFDRNNKVLMNNSVVYDLVIEPSKVKADFDTAFLCKMINVSVQDFDKQIKKQILKYGAWQKCLPYIEICHPPPLPDCRKIYTISLESI
ncbi:MAG: hypothetical protein IPN14_05685 [Bacteroidetes bacterium]|nr:hypothetical protein [Bacteroidota bacterium]